MLDSQVCMQPAGLGWASWESLLDEQRHPVPKCKSSQLPLHNHQSARVAAHLSACSVSFAVA